MARVSGPSPRRLFASAVAGQFLFGITLALFGTLFGIPAVTEGLRLDLPSQARLLVALYSGQLCLAAFAGRLADRFGSLRVLAAGATLLSASLAIVALAGSARSALAGAVVMSVGGAAVNAGSNVLVSMVYGDERGSMLNLSALFGALGAIAVPIVFAGTGSLDAARVRLFALAAFGAITAVSHFLQRQPAHHLSTEEARPSTRAILSDGWVIALVILLAIDFGMESVAAGWFATYTLGVVPDASPTLMVGLYWTALMAGRLAGPALHARLGKLPILATGGTLLALAFAGVSLAATPATLALLVVCTGVALGPMGPTILSVAGARYTRGTGAVFGVMLSLGQIGSVVLPWSVARVATDAGFRMAMLLPATAGVLLALFAASLWVRRGALGYVRTQAAET
jgi:MFS family permease